MKKFLQESMERHLRWTSLIENIVERVAVDGKVLGFDSQLLLDHDVDYSQSIEEDDGNSTGAKRARLGFFAKGSSGKEDALFILALNGTPEAINLRAADGTAPSFALKGARI